VIENYIEKCLAILFYQIESNSAFRSFFTSEDYHQDEFVVKVWTEEFNAIETMKIQPQIIN
jgi:hypothetical protein